MSRRVRMSLMAPLLVAVALLAGCGSSLNSGFAAVDSSRSDASKSNKSDQASMGLASTSATPEKPRTKAKDQASAVRAAETLTAASNPASAGYKIGPQDMLEFSVFKAPELSRSIQVSEAGTINLPLIGEVQAGGRTALEVEREVATKLGRKYLQNPQVTIVVKEYNSQRVTVEGSVRKPGVYPLRGQTTLLQVIAMAEGLGELSDTTIVVFRQQSGQRMAAKFDLASIRTGDTPDPLMQAGDTVVVPNSTTKEAFSVIIKAIPLATVFALL